MSTLPHPRFSAVQPYHLPDPNSVHKRDDSPSTVQHSQIIKQEIRIQNNSTSSIATHASYESTTPNYHPQHDINLAPSVISEDELSIRISSASVLTFSSCGSTETITQVLQLAMEDETGTEAEDRISFDERDWKRAGMTPSREPNERYERGAKDGLRIGRVPPGLVSAARGSGGGGGDAERNLGDGSGGNGGSGEGGEDSGGNGGSDRGDEEPERNEGTEAPIRGQTTEELAMPNAPPRAFATIPAPVKYTGLLSTSITSTQPANAIAADIVRVLTLLGIRYEPIEGGYYCVWAPSGSSTKITPLQRGRMELDLMMFEKLGTIFVELEILIVKMVPLMRLHGLRFKKLAGNTYQYKNIAEHILKELRL